MLEEEIVVAMPDVHPLAQRPLVHAADLSRPDWQASVSDEAIAQTIRQGRGRMPSFNKVVVIGIVGNEDGAHHVTAELLQALNDTGWTAAGQAACYWVGEAMHKTDFKDLPKVPDDVQGLAGIQASNAAHLANLLKERPFPGVPKNK